MFSLEPLGEIEDLRSLPINTYPVGKVRLGHGARVSRDRHDRPQSSDPLVGDLRGREGTDQGRAGFCRFVLQLTVGAPAAIEAVTQGWWRRGDSNS
jgi:hypothetical protein